MLHFDSDYMRGAHPAVLEKLVETNLEQTVGYGSDPYTQEGKQKILEACGLNPQASAVHFLVGGTQTNATVIDALLGHHEGVLCAETAHINVHEAGAVEYTGHKVLTLPSHEGKIDAGELDGYVTSFYADETCEHMVAPGMVYISYPTEVGTLYTKDELTSIYACCQRHRMTLYIDGARLGYGLASDKCDLNLSELAHLCDVFYIGGTKVGCLFGEAVVLRDATRWPHALSIIKQHGALLAKGRLTGLQFAALFTDGLYLKISRNAVEKAMQLKAGFQAKGYRLYKDSPTNQQFFVLPNGKMDELKKQVSFELWGPRGEVETPVRFVTDWGTSQEEIDTLLHLL